MKIFRRIISGLLALVLVFGFGGIAQTNASACVQVPYTPIEQLGAAPPVVSVPTVSVPVLDRAGFLEEDAAAAYLSTQMQQRNDTIVVKVAAVGEHADIYSDILWKALAHSGEPAGGDYIYRHMSAYGGYYSSHGTSGEYSYYTITYQLWYHTTPQQEQEMDEAVAALLEELDLWEKSDYEKVLGIYDYMTANITYDYDNLEDSAYKLKYTAYAALMNKTAVCQGYASLFYRLALALGVDCRIVAGVGNGGRHAWNIVKLDGKYYNLDATWDASWVQAGLPYEFFLRCEATFDDHIRDPEFDTAAFHSQYPMGTADYTPPAVKCGDADGNGTVDGLDATLLLQYAAGWDVTINEAAGDADGNGVVDGLDATLLLQYAAGWDVSLGAA